MADGISLLHIMVIREVATGIFKQPLPSKWKSFLGLGISQRLPAVGIPFQVENLPTYAVAINDTGQIAVRGHNNVVEVHHAVLWDPVSGLTDLGELSVTVNYESMP